MTEFNRMTIIAAAEVISDFKAHSAMSVLEVQWDIQKHTSATSKAARIASWAQVATQINPKVMTEAGLVSFDRALVEAAIKAPSNTKKNAEWKKLVAGLRFDGFEIVETETEVATEHPWDRSATQKTVGLVRMLPDDIPGLDFREAENEVVALLDRSGFTVANGHLNQALSAFQRGEWSSANGELRNVEPMAHRIPGTRRVRWCPP